jgi:hypothetical protein
MLTLLGIFCVLTAIVLYPDEEGKIQSKFEDFWIRVDDFRNLALSRHTAFMTQVADLETRFLNRVFGSTLISVQSLVFSCWFSLVSFLFAGTSLNTLTHYFVVAVPPFLVILFIGLSLACVAYIFLSNHPDARSTLMWCGCVMVAAAGFQFAYNSAPTGRKSFGESLFFLLVGGFCSDALFIVITRRLLKLAGGMARTRRVVAILIVDCLLAVGLVGPAFLWPNPRFSRFVIDHSVATAFIATVAMSNMFDAALSLLFVLLALILLAHRALWPLLTRTLFRMTDIGTKGRRGILLAVGFALLAFAFHAEKLSELLTKIIEKMSG